MALMMSIYELIETRRTVHRYEPTPVAPELLDKIVRTGHFAPNHKLTWPWRFTLVGPETRQKVAALAVSIKSGGDEISDEKRAAIEAKILNPGGMLVITQLRCDDSFRSKEDYASIACAVQNIQLAAHAEGLGTKWSTGAITRATETYEILGIDAEQEEIQGFIWIGTAAVTPSIKRPPFETVLRKLS